MQTQIPPELLLVDPALAGALTLMPTPPRLWRRLPVGRIHGFAAAEDEAEALRIEDFLIAVRPGPEAAEVARLAILLKEVTASAEGLWQGGRWLVPGIEALPEGMPLAPHIPLPVLDRDLAPGTPFLLPGPGPLTPEGFLTHLLAPLCLVAGTGLRGPIYLHCPEVAEEARAHIAALFPELLPRVIFAEAPQSHAAAVLPFGYGAALLSEIAAELAPDSPEDLTGQIVDGALAALRARGAAIAPAGPRRFWVARADALLPGETELHEMLRLFGFEPLDLEALSVPERIAALAGAEMVICPEGAGLAYMLFAPPQATVIALQSRAMAETEWRAHWPLATVSACRFVTFLTDAAPDGGARLSRLGLLRVMSLIVALLDKLPEFNDPADVALLGRQLIDLGETARAEALFSAHAGLEAEHVGLALSVAELAQARGDLAGALAALHGAYRREPSDWAILIRMLWVARAMAQPELIATLLATLHDGFPERYEAFARTRPWVRDHFNPDTIAQRA